MGWRQRRKMRWMMAMLGLLRQNSKVPGGEEGLSGAAIQGLIGGTAFTIWSALMALEANGDIEGRWGVPAKVGGPRPRIYRPAVDQ